MSRTDGYESVTYTSSDGLKLHARVYGQHREDALPVVCLAGLTRNAADFHDLALHLSRDAANPRQVIAFDYRGRGRSQYDRNWRNYDPAVETGDVLAGMAALGIEHAAFIGTSRGGLIIFILAAMRPMVLKAVVLNDIGPVVDGAGLAHIRSYLTRAPKPKSMEDAIEIQRTLHGSAFPALGDADWTRMVGALYREERGRIVPDYDPALIRTVEAIDLSKPLPTLWPQFDGLADLPVMAIRGENSMMLSAQTLAEMAARHPRLETVTVAGQGHAPLLETGDLPGRIAAFIASAERRA